MSDTFKGEVACYDINYVVNRPVRVYFEVLFYDVAEAERFRDTMMTKVKLPPAPPPPEPPEYS